MSQTDGKGPVLPPILSEESLSALASQIKDGILCLRLALLLNIPETTVVQFVFNISGDAGFRAATEEDVTRLMVRLLLYWNHIKGTAKPKDRISDMDRALRGCGLDKIADAWNVTFGNGTGLTKESFIPPPPQI